LKDERGFLLIQDFLKLCTLVNGSSGAKSALPVSFIHFLCFFTKSWSLDTLTTALSFPKERSLVHSLCQNGHLHLLKEYLQSVPHDASILNKPDADGSTPLTLAFKNNQTVLLTYLFYHAMQADLRNRIKLNLDLSICSKKYGLPLHLALENYDLTLARLMLSVGTQERLKFDITASDNEGNNALHVLMGNFQRESS
jgi:ankyrin repeat protein